MDERSLAIGDSQIALAELRAGTADLAAEAADIKAVHALAEKIQKRAMRKPGSRPWDAAEHLTAPAAIAAYLNAAIEENDPELFLAAISDVARARGMGEVARESGLGRESLYKALNPGSKPRYDTIFRLLHSLGVKLSVEA